MVFLGIIFEWFQLSYKKIECDFGLFYDKSGRFWVNLTRFGWFRPVSARFGMFHVLVCTIVSLRSS